MNQTERRQWIIKELKINKKLEINALSKTLNVSEMTIRRDLKFLENSGILNRISKGAIVNTMNDFDIIDDTLKTRTLQNIEQKKILAKYASHLINDGDVIFLDASTTVYEMCSYIVNKNITIITNSVRIAQFFNSTKNITVILTGGILRYATLSLIGSDCEEFLKKYNTNKVFMSAKAITFLNGLTDVNMFEINTKKIAIKNTNEVIVLLDNTKFNKVSLKKVCDTEQISKLIIDGSREYSKEELLVISQIESCGTEIMIVK